MSKAITSLPSEDRDRVAQLVSERGERAATEVLSITRDSLARVLAGLPVRRGTIALINLKLGRGE
jgi:hypothetical protein